MFKETVSLKTALGPPVSISRTAKAVCQRCPAFRETLSNLTSEVAAEDNKQGTKAQRVQLAGRGNNTARNATPTAKPRSNLGHLPTSGAEKVDKFIRYVD